MAIKEPIVGYSLEEKLKMRNMGGAEGVIAIDNEESMAMEFNTKGMYRTFRSMDNGLYVGMYENR